MIEVENRVDLAADISHVAMIRTQDEQQSPFKQPGHQQLLVEFHFARW